jgi:hypothetical protein
MHFCRHYGITRVPRWCYIMRMKQINGMIFSHYPIYFMYRHQSRESHSTASYLLATHHRETDLTPASSCQICGGQSGIRTGSAATILVFSWQYDSTDASHPVGHMSLTLSLNLSLSLSHTHTLPMTPSPHLWEANTSDADDIHWHSQDHLQTCTINNLYQRF